MRTAFGATAAILLTVSTGWSEVVKPQDVTYVEGAVETSLSGAPGDPILGAEVMNKGAGNCIACHQVTALNHLPFHGEIGPMLDGVADRWTEAELRGIVANAKVMFEGSMMPSFYRTDGFIRLGDAYTGDAHGDGEVQPLLTAQQVEDVVAYLMTLKEE
ncbi:Cytochrome c, mono-and diheme variants [Tritonibacter multivorans]|uniref:Cytochrome c, mono-and diheme variants n=1 Tax=Tritonibacter multivorans TaxID=928856 RepID=A0A0P1GJ68_9RHOB|nr:sulfur oxidation c-type cytochrome SoxX [Tritonibacter multivorans]MDA7421670.1 sulfur oxidation c-type cytochrome SoxX [Tritonibacter multivorans]CUH81967.1 Cytochrome c, mono-and diheme variants [Tritonibacter multivorans]SFC92051.1 monoheme cytochrome SoxX (sulfur oxidation) [Tritonibacter multivorans]